MTNKLQKAYVKCEYQKGMFEHELLVRFPGSTERGSGLDVKDGILTMGGWYFIQKENVKPKDEKFGLLSIIIAEKREKDFSFLIDGDLGDQEYFRAPLEEMIFE